MDDDYATINIHRYRYFQVSTAVFVLSKANPLGCLPITNSYSVNIETFLRCSSDCYPLFCK